MKKGMFLILVLVNFGQVFSQSSDLTKSVHYADQRKSPATAVIATIMFPGSGYWYIGENERGFTYLYGSLIANTAIVYSIRKRKPNILIASVVASSVLRISEVLTVYDATLKRNQKLKTDLGIMAGADLSSIHIGLQASF